tara:strand:+ start:250 stop:666 length:417 start_codon:yes stop_codon:yes gene_type:complete
MKLTTEALKKIIKEELKSVLNELRGAEKRKKFNYNNTDIHVFLVNDMKNQNALSRIKDSESHGEQGFYVVNGSGDLRNKLDSKFNTPDKNKKPKYNDYYGDYFYVVGVTKEQFSNVNNSNPGTKNLLEKNQAQKKIGG